MPAKLNQTIKKKDGTVIEPSELTVEQQIDWSCDSPRCAARHGKTTEFSFKRVETVEDVKGLPDGCSRILKVQYEFLDPDKEVAFCSGQCLKDWVTYAYIPPRTAKQILAEKEAKDAAQLSLPFDPPLNPITAESDATGFVEKCGTPLQDTGDPWLSPQAGAAQ